MDALTILAANKFFIGFAILITNIGSRFVIMDIGKTHEKLLSNELIKKIVIFCMFFVATRDIITSTILTFAFVVFLEGLLNENSRFNVLPQIFKTKKVEQREEQPIHVSPDQYQMAMQTIERFYSQNKIA